MKGHLVGRIDELKLANWAADVAHKQGASKRADVTEFLSKDNLNELIKDAENNLEDANSVLPCFKIIIECDADTLFTKIRKEQAQYLLRKYADTFVFAFERGLEDKPRAYAQSLNIMTVMHLLGMARQYKDNPQQSVIYEKAKSCIHGIIRYRRDLIEEILGCGDYEDSDKYAFIQFLKKEFGLFLIYDRDVVFKPISVLSNGSLPKPGAIYVEFSGGQLLYKTHCSDDDKEGGHDDNPRPFVLLPLSENAQAVKAAIESKSIDQLAACSEDIVSALLARSRNQACRPDFEAMNSARLVNYLPQLAEHMGILLSLCASSKLRNKLLLDKNAVWAWSQFSKIKQQDNRFPYDNVDAFFKEILTRGDHQQQKNLLAIICASQEGAAYKETYLKILENTLSADMDEKNYLNILSNVITALDDYKDIKDKDQQDFLMKILSVLIKNFKIVDAFQPYFIELDAKRDGKEETFKDYLAQKATVNVNSGNLSNRFIFLTGVLKTIVTAEQTVESAKPEVDSNFNANFRAQLGTVIDSYNKERSIKSQMGTRLNFYQPAINNVLSFEAHVPVKERKEVLVKRQGETIEQYNERLLEHVNKLLLATQSLKESKLHQLFNLSSLIQHLGNVVKKLSDTSDLRIGDKLIKNFLQNEIEGYSFVSMIIHFSSRVEGLLNIMQVLLKAQGEKTDTEALKRELTAAVSLYKSDNKWIKVQTDVVPVDSNDAMSTCRDSVHSSSERRSRVSSSDAGNECTEDGISTVKPDVLGAKTESVDKNASYKRVKSSGLFSNKSTEVKEEPKRRYSFAEFVKVARAAFFGLAVSVASVNVAAADENERDLNDSDRKTETVLRDADDDKERFRRHSI